MDVSNAIADETVTVDSKSTNLDGHHVSIAMSLEDWILYRICVKGTLCLVIDSYGIKSLVRDAGEYDDVSERLPIHGLTNPPTRPATFQTSVQRACEMIALELHRQHRGGLDGT